MPNDSATFYANLQISKSIEKHGNTVWTHVVKDRYPVPTFLFTRLTKLQVLHNNFGIQKIPLSGLYNVKTIRKNNYK